ncbi:MAG TPA: STAS domain-containing protein [Acidimicrobiales bacterium]|nr:STAS domain-containing protein [Acidimicrobiales bacterium]
MPLSIAVLRTGDRAVLTVTGEIDIRSAPELREQLQVCATEGVSEVEIDLRTVTFLDSTALSVMVGAHKRLARDGGALEVRTAGGAVRRVLEVTGLDRVFRVTDG